MTAVRPNGQDDSPQFKLDIDDVRAGSLGIPLTNINDVLPRHGEAHTSTLHPERPVKKVYLQSDPRYRMLPEDFNSWYVSNKDGQMVPFSPFSSAHCNTARATRAVQRPRISRNSGAGDPGVSTGEAMQRWKRWRPNSAGIGYEWTDYRMRKGMQGHRPALYAISLLVVFLAIAALYESWTIHL